MTVYNTGQPSGEVKLPVCVPVFQHEDSGVKQPKYLLPGQAEQCGHCSYLHQDNLLKNLLLQFLLFIKVFLPIKKISSLRLTALINDIAAGSEPTNVHDPNAVEYISVLCSLELCEVDHPPVTTII